MIKRLKLIAVIALTTLVAGCNQQKQSSPTSSKPVSGQELAQNLVIKYQVVTNRTDDKCDKGQTDDLCFQAQISLTSNIDFVGNDWVIYFSNMAPVQREDSHEFDIEHINGDLHKITPTAGFGGFAAGELYEIPFKAGFWHLSQTDMMPNYYLVVGNEEPLLITSTVPTTDPETGLELLPHSVPLTLEDHHFKRTPDDKTQPATANWLYNENAENDVEHDVTAEILPKPKSVKLDKGTIDLANGLMFDLAGFDRRLVEGAIDRLAVFGVKESAQGRLVRFVKDTGLGREAYKLKIQSSAIEVTAATETGAFYAMQSLASLLTPGVTTVPQMMVSDEPRYAFRGMHLDVSRNFKSKEFVLTVLEQMAAHKLNKFHFHLADDEGWRVEIPDLPELTDIGAFRCHDFTEQTCLLPQLGSGPYRDSPVNGYYSVEDYKEILAFATKHHIQVIPSMDMPGHSRAAIKSMAARHTKLLAQGKVEQAKQYLLHDVEDSTEYTSIQFYNDNTINACMDSSYDFLSKVVDELAIMHGQMNNPLTRYHIGADETAGAWINSPACESLLKDNVSGIKTAEDISAYFIEKVSRMLAKKGIEAAGWSDGMGHTKKERMPEKVQSNAWTPLMWGGHESAHDQVNRGWDVVVSSPDALYFDFPYEADANERGYYWAARRINTQKVFEMMPDNLPVHAEFWLDRQELPYEAKDTESKLKPGGKFHGMQGQFWGETVRLDNQASYMIFPRLFALAERAWHQAEWEVPYNYEGAVYNQNTNYFTDQAKAQQQMDWQRFSNVLAKKVMPKLDLQDVFYRLPTPGAQIENGQLMMNSLYPSLTLEYKQKGGKWQRYHNPVNLENIDIEVRSITQNGQRASRILKLN